MAHDKNQSQILQTDISFYLDDRTAEICDWVVFVGVCQIINVFGIVTNIINIVCFVKQGFKDSTNISLVGLSASDLACLITTVFTCILYTPAVVDADSPFDTRDIQYVVVMMPHFVFTRVSGYITAMIALERCLSIVAPLKVKSIITPEIAGISIVCIFIINTISSTPFYIANWLGSKFSISRNKTVIGLTFRDDKELIELCTFSINNFFMPVCAFVIVVVCTVILTSELRSSSEWRKTTTNDGQSQKITKRNKKVAKMVVSICILFISCFVPNTIIMLAVALEPELLISGKYFKASKILGGCSLLLESINSSVNIFIYHHMSTKYRTILLSMFISRKKCIS